MIATQAGFSYRDEEKADKYAVELAVDVLREMRSGYAAARNSRYRTRPSDIAASGSNADYHYRNESDFWRQCEWARDYDRNNCLVAQGINRLVGNVLMRGPTLSPETGNEELDLELYTRITAHANNRMRFDCRGERTLNEHAAASFRSELVDGDICNLPLSDRTVQAMELHRLRSPNQSPSGKSLSTTGNIVHGVQTDRRGRAVKYWFTQDDQGFDAFVKQRDLVPCEAFLNDEWGEFANVWHLKNVSRTSQTRGTTIFGPIFDILGMHDDIQLAKLVEHQVASCIAIVRQEVASAGFMGQTAAPLGAERTETQSDGSQRIVHNLTPGLELRAKSGEKIEAFTPNIHSQGWIDQATVLLAFIAVNMGLPPMVFMLDPSSNFSGHRGAMEQARIGFRRWQDHIDAGVNVPWYRWQVRQELLADRYLFELWRQSGVGLNVFNHRWNPHAWPYIQPKEEAEARSFRRSVLLASPRKIAAEEGEDWETLVDDSIADNVYLLRSAAQAADVLNREFPGNSFTWKEVIQPMPSGVTNQFPQPDNTQAAAPTGKPKAGATAQ
jgi:capsid protein